MCEEGAGVNSKEGTRKGKGFGEQELSYIHGKHLWRCHNEVPTLYDGYLLIMKGEAERGDERGLAINVREHGLLQKREKTGPVSHLESTALSTPWFSLSLAPLFLTLRVR